MNVCLHTECDVWLSRFTDNMHINCHLRCINRFMVLLKANTDLKGPNKFTAVSVTLYERFLFERNEKISWFRGVVTNCSDTFRNIVINLNMHKCCEYFLSVIRKLVSLICLPCKIVTVKYELTFTLSCNTDWQYLKPLTCGDRINPVKLVNIMVADALAPCVARTSAPMILTIWNRYKLLSYLRTDFNYPCHVNVEEWYQL